MNTINLEIKEWEINTSEYDGFGMDLLDPISMKIPRGKTLFINQNER